VKTIKGGGEGKKSKVKEGITHHLMPGTPTSEKKKHRKRERTTLLGNPSTQLWVPVSVRLRKL